MHEGHQQVRTAKVLARQPRMGSLRLSGLPRCTQTKHRRLFGGRWLWLAIILCFLLLGVLGNEDDEFEGEDEQVVPIQGITHEITESGK